MSQPATRTRRLTLRVVFEAHGVPPREARAAAGVLNARYPVVIASGIAGVVRRMTSRGVEAGEAERIAPVLFAFELLDRGGTLTDAIRLLERQGLSNAEALGVGLEAAALYRDTEEALPRPSLSRFPWRRIAAGAALTAGFLLAAGVAL